MRKLWSAVAIGLLGACFSEPSSGGETGDACPLATLGCPCDEGQCGANLACEASIDRCVDANCEPGEVGCTCLDGACNGGATCNGGVCSVEPGTGTAGVTSTSSSTGADGSSTTGLVTSLTSDSLTSLTDDATLSDTVTESSTLDTGPTCEAPTCESCESCGACATCTASPGGSCAASCQGNAICEDMVACAMGLVEPMLFTANCCEMGCFEDKVCSVVFNQWTACMSKHCDCAYSC